MFSMTRFGAGCAAILVASACGGGNPVTPIDGAPGTFTVEVFAGAPVVGATVHVFAVDPDTGKALTNRPDKGLLGTSDKPTDEKGMATVKVKGFSGFVQIVAAGGSYLDPTDPKTTVDMPGTAQLSSFLGLYKAGTNVTAAVSCWTTLADVASRAYALGLNPYSPAKQTIPNAMLVTDTLFAHHLDPKATWSVRSVLPAPFNGPQTLRDTSSASLGDVALNSLAAKIGGGATAFTLLAALTEDLEADGQFDGYTVKGGSTVPITVASTKLSAETTRGELAHALDAYATSSANLSGLTRDTFVDAKVYEAMAEDASLIYPDSVPPPKWVLEGPPGTVTAVVSAGEPVVGATVKVFAVDAASGQVLVNRPDQGLLGTAGPTDSAGRIAVPLGSAFSGAIHVVATMGTYVDPTDSAVSITLADGGELTSFVGAFAAGTEITVPVTSWTTLADAAAQAYALGRNPATAGKTSTLAEALAVVDPLVEAHFDRRGLWKLRTTQPGGLGSPLTGAALATLAELSLHQLARNIAAGVGSNYPDSVSPGTLLGLLVGDLAADGQFDGKAENGQLISVPGATPYTLTTETTRGVLARALDAFMQSPRNGSSVKRAQLEAADVYKAMALDPSVLYPDTVPPPTFTLASIPPSLTVISAPAWSQVPTATIVVEVTDNSDSGIQKVLAQVGTATPILATLGDAGAYSVNVTLRGDSVATEIALWAVDNLGNSGVEGDYARQSPYYVVATVGLDNKPPTISISGAASYYSEQDLALASDAVPAVYAFKSSTKATVDEGHLVTFKASSRMSYGPNAPSVDELTSTNAFNTPFIRFAVPYAMTDGAPILRPKYRVTRTDSEADPPEAELLGDPKSGSGGVIYFYLPLAQETLFPNVDTHAFPSIGTSFRVSVTVSDEAGNSATVDFPKTSPNDTFEYAFTPAPVFVALDGNYSKAVDPSSAHRALVADQTYARLWAGADRMRYARYIVSNPSGVGVLARFVLANTTIATTENWPVQVDSFPHNFSETYNGQVFVHPQLFSLYGCTYGDPTMCPPSESWPCGGTVAAQQLDMCASTPGPTQQQAFSGPGYTSPTKKYTCLPSTFDEDPDPLLTRKATEPNALAHQAFVYQPTPSAETVVVTPDATGAVFIPPAAGGLPGRRTVYVTRVGTARPSNLPTLTLKSWPFLAKASWATWLYDSWQHNGVKTTEGADGIEGCYHAWYRHYELFTAAEETATYVLSFSALAAKSGGQDPTTYFGNSQSRSETVTAKH